jgi:tight adherence protein B
VLNVKDSEVSVTYKDIKTSEERKFFIPWISACDLQNDGDFSSGIQKLKAYFSDQNSDQIFEAILLSKSLGGNELMSILRTVGDFIRQDVALRKEIEIKHGWVKNSAHLSAAAPWLLLLLLSTQPGTVSSYSNPTGALILAAGVGMTALAYIWMNYLGRLPRIPRVFSQL